MKMEYPIFFLSFDEPNADRNWSTLKERHRRAVRVHGIAGIREAHRLCAAQCSSDMFYVVDGDNELEAGFTFSHLPAAQDRDAVHVWRCLNPVNDLVYGYGAVKLFPREGALKNISGVDMSTSLAKKYKIMPELASVTRFNTSPLSAWRSAFRECVKLSGEAIENPDPQTEARLEAWCNLGADREFGSWVIRGANAGREYGRAHRGDQSSLARINDYRWLRERFEELL